MRHSSRFALIRSIIFLDRSTKVTWTASRDRASMPIAPEPEQRSRKRESLNSRCDYVEECFAQPIGCRPHLQRRRAFEITAAIFAGNDSHNTPKIYIHRLRDYTEAPDAYEHFITPGSTSVLLNNSSKMRLEVETFFDDRSEQG